MMTPETRAKWASAMSRQLPFELRDKPERWMVKWGVEPGGHYDAEFGAKEDALEIVRILKKDLGRGVEYVEFWHYDDERSPRKKWIKKRSHTSPKRNPTDAEERARIAAQWMALSQAMGASSSGSVRVPESRRAKTATKAKRKATKAKAPKAKATKAKRSSSSGNIVSKIRAWQADNIPAGYIGPITTLAEAKAWPAKWSWPTGTAAVLNSEFGGILPSMMRGAEGFTTGYEAWELLESFDKWLSGQGYEWKMHPDDSWGTVFIVTKKAAKRRAPAKKPAKKRSSKKKAPKRTSKSTAKKGDFKVGEIVVFGRKYGEQTLAKVISVNVKTISLETLEGRGRRRDYKVGSKWRAPRHLIRKATAAEKRAYKATGNPYISGPAPNPVHDYSDSFGIFTWRDDEGRGWLYQVHDYERDLLAAASDRDKFYESEADARAAAEKAARKAMRELEKWKAQVEKRRGKLRERKQWSQGQYWKERAYGPSVQVTVPGEIVLNTGAGTSDDLTVYDYDGDKWVVLIVNRPLEYAGIEVYDDEGEQIDSVFLQNDWEIEGMLGKRGLDLSERTMVKRMLERLF
jgi:hypothetical protein